MTSLRQMTASDVRSLHVRTLRQYEIIRAEGLCLDMTRGKPSPEQLDLSSALLTLPGNRDYLNEAGEDARSYGGQQGLPEARALFAPMLQASPDRIVVTGNSSLALMHDCMAWALLRGVPGSPRPWADKSTTFICPVPGYDRHFTVCEAFDVRMLAVPLTGHGPDMDEVERLVADPSVKGMWCVPKYSNPSGEVYSPATVMRLAAMRTGAPDFRLFWDNAYSVHHLTERHHEVADVLSACEQAGHPDRAFVFGSTSKITVPGAGLSLFASSAANVAWFIKHSAVRTIGPDQMNQLRHVRLLRDQAHLQRHMAAHQALIKPKFSAVWEALEAELGNMEVARWSQPEGGYFIAVETTGGSARRVVDLARDAGVKLTPAGATWPYGDDPHDRTLRLAPTFPPLEDVRSAARAIAVCILLASIEMRLRELRGAEDTRTEQ